MKVTDTYLKGIKSKDKKFFISDGAGLLVEVRPNGKKAFVFEYKSPATLKITRMVLGEYPILTLGRAREMRLELQRKIIEGIDPKLEKKESEFVSFKRVYNEWILKKTTQLTPKSAHTIQRYFERFFLPAFGDIDIKKISRQDILKSLEYLEFEKKYVAFSKALGKIKELYRYAVLKEYVNHNIVLDIDKKALFKAPTTKHYSTLLNPNDIKDFLNNLLEYQGDIRVKVCMVLHILTAVRPTNARTCEWNDIDLKNGIWTIPASKMKMDKPHILHLNQNLCRFLENYRSIVHIKSSYIFPSLRSSSKPISDNTARCAMRNMGYTKEQITPHGFRAMFSTLAHENRVKHKQSSDIIELCLAHIETNKVKTAYNHAKNLKERKALMLWWQNYIETLCPDIYAWIEFTEQ